MEFRNWMVLCIYMYMKIDYYFEEINWLLNWYYYLVGDWNKVDDIFNDLEKKCLKIYFKNFSFFVMINGFVCWLKICVCVFFEWI